MCVYTERTSFRVIIFLPLRKVFVYRDDIGDEVACKLKLYIYKFFFVVFSRFLCFCALRIGDEFVFVVFT